MDLYLTLINPFHPRDKRIPFYIITIGLIGIFVMIDICLYFKRSDTVTIFLYDDNNLYSSIFVEAAPILFLWPVIPSILIMIRLCKRGTSSELRTLVVKRHIIYNILYFFVILNVLDDQYKYLLDFSMFIYRNEPNEDIKFEKVMNLQETQDVMFSSLIMLIFVCRVSEPFVYNNLI
jgi:hypothetical protein